MFLDMCRLERVCLSVNGICDSKSAPVGLESLQESFPDIEFTPSLLAMIPSFSIIPKTYSIARHAEVWGGHDHFTYVPDSRTYIIESRKPLYDMDAAYTIIMEQDKKKDLKAPLRANPALKDRRRPWQRILERSASCVIAPWLKKNSMVSEWATFCSACQQEEDRATSTKQGPNLTGNWDDAGIGKWYTYELRMRHTLILYLYTVRNAKIARRA